MSKNVNLADEAYELLKKFKAPNQSFSDVILNHFQDRRLPAETAGELLDRLESTPPPAVNQERLKALRSGRGRRSERHTS